METPKLLMDRSRILSNFQEISAALPRFHVAYAMKANPHPEILRLLFKAGSHFETASYNEIETLLQMGVPAEKIIFSNPVKPLEAISGALEKGIVYHSFDSLGEAEKYLSFKDRVRLILRIDVSNKGSLWTLAGKFGLPRIIWKELFVYMQENQLPLAGVTFHVGSQCETVETWDNAMNMAYEALQMARTYGLNPDTLNIGGGYPIHLGRDIPSVAEIGAHIASKIRDWENEGLHLNHFYAEPGRFIAGSAGNMLSHIIGIAKRQIGDKLEKWVYLDTGVFTGLMETIDGITYPILSNGSGEPEEVMLCGPSCDGADKMYKTVLPEPKVGDSIYFSGAGAYSTVYSSNFNGIDAPKIVFLDSAGETEAVV